MNSPNIYYKMQRLFAKMHQIEDKSKKMEEMQVSRLKKLEEERDQALVALQEAKQMKEGSKDEKLAQISKTSDKFALIETQLQTLKLKFGKAKTEFYFDFEALKQNLLDDLKESVQGKGRCLMLIEIKNEELKCPLCQITASEDNPLKQICSAEHLECLFCAKEEFKCHECGLVKDISSSSKSDKLLKEVKLLEEIVEELDCNINNPAPQNTETAHLKAELAQKQEEIQELREKIKEQVTSSVFEAFRIEQEGGINDLIAIVKENASNTVLLGDQLLSINDLLKSILEGNNQNSDNMMAANHNGAKEAEQSRLKSHCFLTKNNNVMEFEEDKGEIVSLNEREKIAEKSNFVFWLNKLQFCASANFKERKWKIELFDFDVRKSMIHFTYGNNLDSFFRTGNTVYLFVNMYPFKLCRIAVKKDRLSAQNIPNIKSRVFFVVESENFIVFSTSEALEVVSKADLKFKYKIEMTATALALEGEIVSVVNSNGRAFKIRIEDKKVLKEVELEGNSEACIFGDKIGIRKQNKFRIFDWRGTMVKELSYSGQDFALLHQTLHSSVLTDKDKKVFILNHTELYLMEYPASILNVYS